MRCQAAAGGPGPHWPSAFGKIIVDRVAAGCEGEAMNVDVLRYAAFTGDPASGNPAGVVPDAGQLTEQDMLGIAAEVGYS